MKNYSRGLIIWLLVVVLLAGGYVAYKLLTPDFIIGSVPSNQTTTTNSQTSITPRETLSWKTYANSQYGFEFKYPVNFPVSTPGEQKYAQLAIRIEKIPANFVSLQTFFETLAKKEEVEGNKTSATGLRVRTEKMKVGNAEGYAKVTEAADAPKNTDVEIYIPNSANFIVISYGYQASVISTPQFDDEWTQTEVQKYKTIQQILATFKFVK